MNHTQRPAGQPLLVLAAVLIGWVAIRAAAWQFGDRGPDPAVSPFAEEQFAHLHEAHRSRPVVRSAGAEPARSGTTPPALQARLDPLWEAVAGAGALQPRGEAVAPLVRRSLPSLRGQRMGSDEASAHSLLWFAAMAQVPMADDLRRALANRDAPRPAKRTNPNRRLGFDGWLFLREGGTAVTEGGIRGTAYGQSQLGAVVWWHAAPASRLDPRFYLRGTKALAGDEAGEAALGLSARPAAALPVSLHAEMRMTIRPGSHELRPAFFAAGGGEREDLPLGLAVRGYAQAGWVGGDFQTGFVDGSVTARREVARFDLGHVSAGAGVWGGAQKGAGRLDIGPSASVDIEVVEVPLRISADYRFRVAGEAAPQSGAALTLSSGF